MIRVNLLAPGTEPAPAAWRRCLSVAPDQRAALFGLAMLLSAASGAGFWYWSVNRERRAVDIDIAAAEAAMTQLRDAPRLMDRDVAREKHLRERLVLIERLRVAQRAPVILLDTISRSLADGLWLVELRQTGQAVHLEGRALSYSALTEFIDRLQSSGLFARAIDIVTTSTESMADASVVRFAIRGEVGTGGGS